MTEFYVGYYSESGDITFIMRELWGDGEPIESEVVGFYYGKPNDEDTERYKNSRIAKFN